MNGQFSPSYAYPIAFPEAQYYGTARYPGNTVFSTVGAVQQVKQFADTMAKNGVYWLITLGLGLIGGAIIGKQQAGSLDKGWGYIVGGATLPVAILAFLYILGFAFKYLT